MNTPRQPLQGLWRRCRHVAVIIFGWCAFFYAWLLVLRTEHDYSGVIAIMLWTLVLSPAITLCWVLHNRALFRAKGPRQGNMAAPFEYRTDWNDTPVIADWPQLRGASDIRIEFCAEGKRYLAVPAPEQRYRERS